MTTELLAPPPASPQPAESESSLSAQQWSLRKTEVIEGTKALPEDQKGDLRWLDDYGRQRNLRIDEVAPKLLDRRDQPYSPNYIYKVMTGRSDGSANNFARAVRLFRQKVTESVKAPKFPFVDITLSRSIIGYCEKCHKSARMGLVYGRNQSGKTEAFKQLKARRAYGQVKLWRMPTNGYLSQLLAMVARSEKISTKQPTSELRENIIDLVDETMIVVLDEIHQCFLGSGNRAHRVETIEFAREIFDRKGATVIACGTPLTRKHMEEGEHEELFAQLRHRALPPYNINPIIPVRDLDKIAEAIDLDPADGPALTLQEAVIEREGLGYWIMYLDHARGEAEKAGRKVRWSDVLEADRFFQKVSNNHEKGKK